jgi:hypothetical protein
MSTPAGFATFPPRAAIPSLQIHESVDRKTIDPTRIFEAWLGSLLKAIRGRDAESLSDLFLDDSWWRDLAGLTWDFTSKSGVHAITKYLVESSAGLQEMNPLETPPLHSQLVDMGPMTYIQSGFAFQTRLGSGRGVARLGNVGPNCWKAWLVSTELTHLNQQHEQNSQQTIPPSIQELFVNDVTKQEGLELEDVQVLVVGGGKCTSTILT